MPKSRSRRKGGKSRPVRRAPRQLHPADRLLRDARQLLEIDDVLTAETWASGWLGQAWSTATMTEHEPEHQLCMQITGRASTTPSPHSLAAIDALARVAPAADLSMLTDGPNRSDFPSQGAANWSRTSSPTAEATTR